MDRIIVEHQPGTDRLSSVSLYGWREWTREPDEFPRYYGNDEICYFLEGSAVVIPDDGNPLEIARGDLVTFPAGTSCTWKIQEGIKALYQPDDLYNLLI